MGEVPKNLTRKITVTNLHKQMLTTTEHGQSPNSQVGSTVGELGALRKFYVGGSGFYLRKKKNKTAKVYIKKSSLIGTHVVFPYALPISLETVSLNLVQKLATNPSLQS